MHTLVSYQYPSLVTSPRAPCERVESGDTRVSSPAPGLGTRLAVSTVRACVQLSLLKRGGSLDPGSPDPTLSRGETFLAGRRAWAGHETNVVGGPWAMGGGTRAYGNTKSA